MKTTRERLEAAIAELDKTATAVEAGHATDAELAVKMANVDRAKADYRIAQLTNPPSPGFPRDLASAALGAAGEASIKTVDHADRVAAHASLAFSESDIKGLHDAARLRHVGTTKAALSSTTVPMAAIGDYRTTPFGFLRDLTRIADFIPTERTDAPTVFYYRALAAATGAATVAAGASKPESTPTWEALSATVTKIAHYASAHDEVIADFGGFINLLGTEMIAGLIDTENEQLLRGDGTGTELLGLLNTAGILSLGSTGTDLDAIATGINAIRVTAHVEPDLIVMHPNDWASSGFLLAKDSQGNYLLGSPSEATTPRLWGVRVALTTAMTENTALIANMNTAARLYVRQPPTLEVQPAAGDDAFIKNLTMVRAEERLALTVVRPSALCLVGAI